MDEDDIISATEEVKDGLTYYYYEINAGYAKVSTDHFAWIDLIFFGCTAAWLSVRQTCLRT